MQNKARAGLILFFGFICVFLLPHPALAATATSTTISGNVVWTKAAGPYLVSSVYVLQAATLTIEPGTVIMVTLDSTPFTIEGRLNIGSAGGERVSITSARDDGGTTAPARGDWRDIIVYPGGMLNVVNTDITYGGSIIPDGSGGFDHLPLIENDGGTVYLDYTKLSAGASDGVRLNAGSATVSSSTFTNLGSAGISGNHAFLRVFGSTFDNMAYGMFVSTGSTLDFGQNTFSNIISHKAIDFGSSQMHFLDRGGNSGQGSIFLAFQLTEDTVFPKDGLAYEPYTVEVPLGRTLTVLPGAVIKMNPTSNFAIAGNLLVGSSTVDEKVYVTSIKDDSILGDTNYDGGSTPLAGDWQDLSFSTGSSGSISNTIIRYGGSTSFDPYIGAVAAFPSIKNGGGTITLDKVMLTQVGNYGFNQNAGSTTITNSLITNATHDGIVVGGGSLVVHNSSIHNNVEYGIFNGRQSVIDATSNWWGAFGGPTHPSNPFGSGDRVSDNVNFGQWLTEEPQGTCVTNCYSNVLFLPGIEASRLYRPNDLHQCDYSNEFGEIISPPECRLWEPGGDVLSQYLALDLNGKSIWNDVYTKDVVDKGYGSADIYSSFLINLEKMKSVDHLIADYSAPPYDWRLSVYDILNGGTKTGSNISYLTQTSNPYVISELRRLAGSSKNGKVTIIAHSNGGIVAKTLLKKLEDSHDPLLAKVDKVIFVATPHLGTPQAIGALLHGYKQGIPDTWYLPNGTFISAAASRILAHDFPGAYNLLPSDQYFHNVRNPVATFDASTLLLNERQLYGSAIGNVTELRSFLLNEEHRILPVSMRDTKTPNSLNPLLLQNTEVFHSNIDRWVPTSTIKVYEIAGWGVDTVSGIAYKEGRQNGEAVWDYDPILTEDGDGTVVAPSALAMSTSAPNVKRYWVDLFNYNDTSIDRKHSDILEVPDLRNFIKNKKKKSILNAIGYCTICT